MAIRLIVLILLLLVFQSVLAQSAEVQALEAQIKELKRMGMSGPEIQQLEDMLVELKRMDAEDGTVNTGPPVKPNYFDVANRPQYADCDQYDGMQYFSWCATAAQHYQSYLRAVAAKASEADLDKIYDAHMATVKVLIRMREN